MSKRSSGPLRSSPPNKPTRLSVRVAGGLAILAIVYGALVGGEILAELRLDALQEKAARTYAEAFEIEADRFRTEDIPQIHEAVAQGYEQNLFLTAFERGDFLELTGQHKIAPLAPQPLSQLYYCNEGYGLVRYESDRFGFRNDDALWERPDIDAVLIGDSYVHGACVDHANTIAGHMQANGLDAALNLATGGNGPIHYAALAKTFLPVIKPKYALFFFFANDNKDETQSVYRKVFFGDVAPTYFQPQDGQGRPSRVSDALAGLYGEARALLHVPGVDSTLVPAPMAHTRPPPEISFFEKVKGALSLRDLRSIFATTVDRWRAAGVPPWSTRLAIDTALSVCHEIGCRPIFFYLPNSDFWSPDYRAESYRRSIQAYIAGHELRGQFVDLSSTIDRMGLDGFSPKGKHYSKEAYAQLAQAVLRTMAGN